MPVPDLKIGSCCFSPVVTAPMAGVTDRPMRRMMRCFGGELLFSEMVLAASLVHAHQRTRQMAVCEAAESPVAVQLEGNAPAVMAEAARIVEETKSAALIDINMGCPVQKIVKGGGGSALMKDPERAEKMIKAVVAAVSLPVTVKFRLGWDDDSINYLDFGKRMENAGAAAVTLHARTRNLFYAGKADWDAIACLKQNLTLPVIGNGDVRSPQEAEKMLSQTGVDGVMIGRGLLGKPWTAAACTAYLNDLPAPVLPNLVDIVLDHFREMEKYYGHKAIFIARKHVAWYSLGKEGGADFRAKINQTADRKTFLSLIEDFFNQTAEHDTAK